MEVAYGNTSRRFIPMSLSTFSLARLSLLVYLNRVPVTLIERREACQLRSRDQGFCRVCGLKVIGSMLCVLPTKSRLNPMPMSNIHAKSKSTFKAPAANANAHAHITLSYSSLRSSSGRSDSTSLSLSVLSIRLGEVPPDVLLLSESCGL